MSTEADNIILLSENGLNRDGGSITAVATANGYFTDDMLDNNRETWWQADNSTASVTWNTGAVLGESADRFFLDGNIDTFLLEFSSDGTTYSTAYSTAAASGAALHTLTASSTYQWWKLIVRGTSDSTVAKIYHCGVFAHQHQFDDGENPKFSDASQEGAPAQSNHEGRQWSANFGRVYGVSLELRNIKTATKDILTAYNKTYRNRCALMVQPSTYPEKLYEVRQGSFNLPHRGLKKGIGFAGTMQFGSA